jgi:hypothetical protein
MGAGTRSWRFWPRYPDFYPFSPLVFRADLAENGSANNVRSPTSIQPVNAFANSDQIPFFWPLAIPTVTFHEITRRAFAWLHSVLHAIKICPNQNVGCNGFEQTWSLARRDALRSISEAPVEFKFGREGDRPWKVDGQQWFVTAVVLERQCA